MADIDPLIAALMARKTPEQVEASMPNQYQTKLTPEQAAGMPAWAATLGAQQGRTGEQVMRDAYDYDIHGAYLSGLQSDGRGHLADTFKKPNHPTFSTQSQYHGVDGNAGGIWSPAGRGIMNFDPGPTNMEHMGPGQLREYWNRAEAPQGHTLRGRRW
jgi:hypothetical protein